MLLVNEDERDVEHGSSKTSPSLSNLTSVIIIDLINASLACLQPLLGDSNENQSAWKDFGKKVASVGAVHVA